MGSESSGGRSSMNSRFAALIARVRAQRMLSTLAILATLSVGIMIGTVLSRSSVRGNSHPDAALLPAMQSPQQLSNTFGKVAKQIEPAVVNVSTESTPKVRTRSNRPNRGGQNNGGEAAPRRCLCPLAWGGGRRGAGDYGV